MLTGSKSANINEHWAHCSSLSFVRQSLIIAVPRTNAVRLERDSSWWNSWCLWDIHFRRGFKFYKPVRTFKIFRRDQLVDAAEPQVHNNTFTWGTLFVFHIHLHIDRWLSSSTTVVVLYSGCSSISRLSPSIALYLFVFITTTNLISFRYF